MIFSLIYHDKLMENFIYAIIFIIGTFFGSFFTLAVYRIPKKEDILIKHSYCPNCNQRLGFFDLFPVLSYILLGAKCRYCKKPIRPRYLILEILSGCTFLILAVSIKVNVLNIYSIINLAFLLIYVAILFIIAGIDKENITIEKNVLLFGFCVEILYMIYQYTLMKFNVYQYVIYSILFIALLIIFNVFVKENKRKKYYIQIVCLSLYMIIYTGIKGYILTLIISTLIWGIYKTKNRANGPIGFYLSVANILTIAISNIISSYII